MDYLPKLYNDNLVKLFKQFIITCQTITDSINANEKTTPADLEELKTHTDYLEQLLVDFFELQKPLRTPVFDFHKAEIDRALTKKSPQEFDDMRRLYHQTALSINNLLNKINKRQD